MELAPESYSHYSATIDMSDEPEGGSEKVPPPEAQEEDEEDPVAELRNAYHDEDDGHGYDVASSRDVSVTPRVAQAHRNSGRNPSAPARGSTSSMRSSSRSARNAVSAPPRRSTASSAHSRPSRRISQDEKTHDPSHLKKLTATNKQKKEADKFGGFTKDRLAAERKADIEKFKSRPRNTQAVAPVDHSAAREADKFSRWMKIHFVEPLVKEVSGVLLATYYLA